MKLFLLLISTLYFNISSAQDTTYYNQNQVKIPYSDTISFYSVRYKDVLDTTKVNVKEFTKSSILISDEYYSNYSKGIHHGTNRKWFRNGQLMWEINYTNGNLDGTRKTYWNNGQLKRDDSFINGQLISGKTYDENGDPVEYYNFESQAVFPGGKEELINYLSRNIQYPESCIKGNIKGKVVLKLVIDTDGSIASVRVVRSIHPDMDQEAVRVVTEMPKWEPAQRDGIQLKSYFVLPIDFNF